MNTKQILDKYFDLINEKYSLLYDYKIQIRNFDSQKDDKNLKKINGLFAEELRSLREEYLGIDVATHSDLNKVLKDSRFSVKEKELIKEVAGNFLGRTNIVKIIILAKVLSKERYYFPSHLKEGELQEMALNYYKNNPIVKE